MDQQTQGKFYWIFLRISFVFGILGFICAGVYVFGLKDFRLIILLIGLFIFSVFFKLLAVSIGGLWQPSVLWKVCTYIAVFSLPIVFIIAICTENILLALLVLPLFICASVGVYHPTPEEGLNFYGFPRWKSGPFFWLEGWGYRLRTRMIRSRFWAVLFLLCALALTGIILNVLFQPQ